MTRLIYYIKIPANSPINNSQPTGVPTTPLAIKSLTHPTNPSIPRNKLPLSPTRQRTTTPGITQNVYAATNHRILITSRVPPIKLPATRKLCRPGTRTPRQHPTHQATTEPLQTHTLTLEKQPRVCWRLITVHNRNSRSALGCMGGEG